MSKGTEVGKDETVESNFLEYRLPSSETRERK